MPQVNQWWHTTDVVILRWMSQSEALPPLRPWVPLDRLGSAKVGPKGQIVIPKAMRDRAGMKPGGTVFLRQADDGEIVVQHAYDSVMDAFTIFDRYPVLPGMEGKTSIDILHEMDAEDAEIDERQYQRWTSQDASSSTPSRSSAPSKASRSGRSSRASSRKRSKDGSISG